MAEEKDTVKDLIEEDMKKQKEAAGETAESEAETEKKEERRGLFGAKKRDRNEYVVQGLRILAALYLFYATYGIIKDLMTPDYVVGTHRILMIVFAIIFCGSAIAILIGCWKTYKALIAEEKRLAEIEIADAAEKDPPKEAEEEKQGFLKKLLAPPTEPPKVTISSKAKYYQNPAEDKDAEEDTEDAAGEAEAADPAEEEK